MRSGGLVLGLCLCLCLAPAARAASPCATFAACVHGMQAAARDKDPAAAQRFAEAAYALRQEPDLLFNLGQYHRRQGHVTDAIGFYERYLASGAASLTADVRAEVAGYLTELRAQQAREEADTRAEAAAHDQAEAEARARAEADARARARDTTLVTPAPDRPGRTWRFWTGLPVTGVGLGLATLGAVSLVQDGKCADAGMPCNRRYDTLGEGVGTLVGGGVMVAVGVTLCAVDLARRGKRAR